jgi:hypothetical protein
MKKKKKNVVIATHLLLSNNPTKDQSRCQKIRLKTKVGGERWGAHPKPHLFSIQYKIFLPRLVLCNSSDFSGAQESKSNHKTNNRHILQREKCASCQIIENQVPTQVFRKHLIFQKGNHFVVMLKELVKAT